jgi:Zn ribbon nucleic-acid-binding protein
MAKKSEKKTTKKIEPLKTRVDYDKNQEIPQKNPQAEMIKQVPQIDPKPPVDYDEVTPEVVENVMPPKLNYDNPLPIAPPPVPPPPVMPPVMSPGPVSLPTPKPVLPGVMVCPNCEDGAEIDEEDASDILECPKCGFEIYSSMLDKEAGPNENFLEYLKNPEEYLKKNKPFQRPPENKYDRYNRRDTRTPFPVTNIFWALNTPSDRSEKSRLFENVLRDLGRKNDAYNEALRYFMEFKAKDKFPTKQDAEDAMRKLLNLAVKPNIHLIKMGDFVKSLLSKEPASKMKAIAEELNPGGAARRQKLSDAVQEAAKMLKEKAGA